MPQNETNNSAQKKIVKPRRRQICRYQYLEPPQATPGSRVHENHENCSGKRPEILGTSSMEIVKNSPRGNPYLTADQAERHKLRIPWRRHSSPRAPCRPFHAHNRFRRWDDNPGAAGWSIRPGPSTVVEFHDLPRCGRRGTRAMAAKPDGLKKGLRMKFFAIPASVLLDRRDEIGRLAAGPCVGFLFIVPRGHFCRVARAFWLLHVFSSWNDDRPHSAQSGIGRTGSAAGQFRRQTAARPRQPRSLTLTQLPEITRHFSCAMLRQLPGKTEVPESSGGDISHTGLASGLGRKSSLSPGTREQGTSLLTPSCRFKFKLVGTLIMTSAIFVTALPQLAAHRHAAKDIRSARWMPRRYDNLTLTVTPPRPTRSIEE